MGGQAVMGADSIGAVGAFIQEFGLTAAIVLALLGIVALQVWRERGGPTAPHQPVVRPETGAELRAAKAAEEIADTHKDIAGELRRIVEGINRMADRK